MYTYYILGERKQCCALNYNVKKRSLRQWERLVRRTDNTENRTPGFLNKSPHCCIVHLALLSGSHCKYIQWECACV